MARRTVDWDLLREVSRSFYWSLRLLPAQMREPVALAYLWARLADTLVDNPQALVSSKTRLLAEFRRQLLEEKIAAPGWRGDSAVDHRLFQSVGVLRQGLGALSPDDQKVVKKVVLVLTEGMEMDLALQREAEASGQPAALARTEDLERYTYLIAGCVGEFWTDLAARAGLVRSSPSVQQEAVALGQGLQLVNILRDYPRDLRERETVYFPREKLAAAGLRPADLRAPPESFAALFDEHWQLGLKKLGQGILYLRHLRRRPGRAWLLRVTSSLPLLLGLKSLRLLAEVGGVSLAKKAPQKISRAEVYRTLFWALLTGVSPRWLRREYARTLSSRRPGPSARA